MSDTDIKLIAVDVLVEATKELRRRGAAMVWKGDLVVLVPYLKEAADGRLVHVNRLSAFWRPW